ncbi:MAG: Iron-sulfur cluster insertion protein ErpA [Syntrophorhabdus sp. PtaU1.Bin002]|nr:MAG: Iron-sulfur cluster insertion protein ErpA [Syntrophorhabdus sp. PtaB.Bin006]OPY65243.1 MAG: Iron-sulfur cluster insertion protein ErpA [Syntrophorhabdus sp. PtaU1.Bin002]
MFEVSEKASEKIKQFLGGREGSQFIRILMTEGGWRGPYLVMALDEKKENDQVFTEKGVTFLVEKALFDRVKPITIDYTESTLGNGYTLKSELMKGAVAGCESNICESCEDARNQGRA